MTPEYLPPFSEDQVKAAERVKEQIEHVLGQIRNQQSNLEADFIRLGGALVEVHANQFWILWGFKSFSRYLISLEPMVKLGRTQLYNCLGIARDLLPVVSPEDLEVIGVSKASILRKMLKAGKRPSAELIEIAKRETMERLEGEVAEETGMRRDGDKGRWHSFGGAYYTEDEWEEFIRASNVAAMTDPTLNKRVTHWEHLEWWVKKEIMWRWLASYLAENESAIYQRESGP